METKQHLGIDVSKAKLDVALLTGERYKSAHFDNTASGWQALRDWLVKAEVEQLAVCLEATGRYGEGVAHFLYQLGYQVSMVNPKRIKAYGQSKLLRTKTDPVDAKLIADFCATQKPNLWHPPTPAQAELKAMTRYLEALKADYQREKNRLQSGLTSERVLTNIAAHLSFLEGQIEQLEQDIRSQIDNDPDLKQQKDLLTSIPGIGDSTAALFLAEVSDVRNFPKAEHLTAYAGLSPSHHLSGSSVHKRPRLSKIGNARFRTAFYMPALASLRCNPIIQALAQRLQLRGKEKMVIVGAAMHKLLVLAYGVLKSGQPFDPFYSHLSRQPI